MPRICGPGHIHRGPGRGHSDHSSGPCRRVVRITIRSAYCRYVLRPPIAQEALELTPEGQVLLRLRRPWSDGTRAIRFEPSEFLEKLAAMIPKPRINLLVYHGLC